MANNPMKQLRRQRGLQNASTRGRATPNSPKFNNTTGAGASPAPNLASRMGLPEMSSGMNLEGGAIGARPGSPTQTGPMGHNGFAPGGGSNIDINALKNTPVLYGAIQRRLGRRQ